ncbi:type VII secretion protein EssB [Sporosarcina pasteurii]|uniref:Type VII secretion protein EssB n=1 Tax=Sporosarcina pasteurii TaxID=1474 RepID=A0A380BB34_SPOPA|nr:type VII secretion protein EssB [Sporosarcina pasteurii]MDS9473275.1 type VII secretion protein EssB [Sporosarcina pasteurii]QBQ06506.1 type VII secretion protein EssB [Sporosarcina pasteurii]SUI98301.1 type VII secretion protein EssB [Sporosarcina pasteurii]
MSEKTIELESMTIQFKIEKDKWKLSLPKSQTNMKDIRQLALMTEQSNYSVPVTVNDAYDSLDFSFDIQPNTKRWEDIQKLERNDKLRALCNVARFEDCLSTRITFFLHPNNLVFDDNLMPFIVYRGIRNVVPPFDLDTSKFLYQYKCLAIALFSKKYSFEELYNGSLNHAKDTEFEREINEIEDIHTLKEYLTTQYLNEQKITEKSMQLVPRKRFRTFKQLSIIMSGLSVILAIPLIYFSLMKVPYQEKLLAAHQHFLASDYGQVINDLEGQHAERLPNATKYILAYAYVHTEVIGDQQKAAIMNNISLKSDKSYLLYWIYNGRGDLEKSTDLAKYIDDPVLIIYGLIKQVEQANNDPTLSGSEREERVQNLKEQIKKYQEQYGLLPEDNLTNPESDYDPNENMDD